jgi:hypothetical protein
MYSFGSLPNKTFFRAGLAAMGLLLVPFVGSSQVPVTQGPPPRPIIIGVDGFTTVPGLPFSARSVSEHTQNLADGTHITTRFEIRVFRDSKGRLRVERFQMKLYSEELDDAPSGINIFDPVAGYQYSLAPRAHSATRTEMGPVPVIQGPPPGGNGVNPNRVPPPQPELRPQFSEEQLGTQVVEGLDVIGTKQTTTFPPHSIGNDAPIVTTLERWQSQELRFDVLSIRWDPRSGETKVRVTDINRSEPDPTLFQVPADYTIRGR